MEKRLVFAIALSLLVLMIWAALFPAPKSRPVVSQPIEKQEVVEKKENLPAFQQSVQETSSFDYSTDLFDLTFSLPAGSIKQIYFKKFNYRPENINLIGAIFSDNIPVNFSDYKIAGNKITFTSKEHNITKSYILRNSNYIIELEIKGLLNKTPTSHFWLSIGSFDLTKNPREARFLEADIFSEEKMSKLNLSRFRNQTKLITDENINVFGVRNSHFCYLLKNNGLGKNNVQIFSVNADSVGVSQVINDGNFTLYLGPQDSTMLRAFDQRVANNFTHFNFIAKLLLQILSFFHLIVRNWGLAIILLSFLIYGVLYPLTHKQMQSMKEMQALQPHIENLRKIYKDNPQKLNKEILELYKEHKVNPLGGCLPLVLQIPIFFALYQALSRSLLLKGAKFLWIKDLTEPDKLLIFQKPLPFIGNEFNLLPILMAATMFLQQKISLKSASPAQREQQKMMMVIFPIIFGFIFYAFPSGLVIYWFINSLLTLVYQWKVSK